MTKLLSICIPTYNRASLLDEALRSIAAQPDRDMVQVVISDNASVDNTEEIVEKWRDTFPDLVFHRWASNQGADLNFLKAVELGNGRWRWLFGSDDQLVLGAITQLLPLLNDDLDLVLLDYILMSKDMQRQLEIRHVLNAEAGRVFTLKVGSDFSDYLSHAPELSSLFAYISSIVVRADAWNAVPIRSDFIGSAWIHVTKALDIFSRGGSLLYSRASLVRNRSGNDSFLASVGFTRRAFIDLDYVRIARYVLADQPELKISMLAWLEQRFFSWPVLMALKLGVVTSGGINEARELEVRIFEVFSESRHYLLKRIAWRLLPIPLLRIAREVKRLMRVKQL
jgi:abequosyltransferase